jgi:GalNAc-alpha-(1->4)-GalNAc-alpha-(1->3)-diNAcBac-PP-undecaprenol alpha-1,4-N-acetyl-D-galactosaminyltransferase
MNIVFLISSLGSGGAERVASTLCNDWAARGDTVTLVPTFSGGGQPFYALHEKIELLYLSGLLGPALGGGKRYLARLLALRRLVRERKPDVVVSFLPNVNIAALAATAFSGVPCIVCERSDPSVQAIGAVWRIACKLFYRYADLVTVQTQTVAAGIQRVYGGLNKVSVVPNPLPRDLGRWHADLGAPRTRRTLLSLGRLSKEKRVDHIIDAFAALVLQFPEWDLHIYGDGPERVALQVRIDRLGLNGRAQLFGRSNDPWQVMAGVDAFVMASSYEGFPNALLEAMGIGLPCVAADCPSGPREISHDGLNAVLFQPGDAVGLIDALARLFSNKTERMALGQRARSSVFERYSLRAVRETWDDLFAAVRKPS